MIKRKSDFRSPFTVNYLRDGFTVGCLTMRYRAYVSQPRGRYWRILYRHPDGVCQCEDFVSKRQARRKVGKMVYGQYS